MQNARHIKLGKVRLIIIAKCKTHQIRKGEVNNYCKVQDIKLGKVRLQQQQQKHYESPTGVLGELVNVYDTSCTNLSQY